MLLECGKTPLHYAAQHGYKNVVDILIQSGANIDEKSSSGWTPLYLANSFCSEGAVQTLVNSGADINTVDTFNITPLHWAAQRGNEKIIDILIKANVNAVDNYGRTPLHFVADNAYNSIKATKVIRLLLASGANPFIKDKYGRIPSQLARAEEVKILLRAVEKKFMIEKRHTT